MNIAVIIPVYKVEPYLRKCVDSVLVQTCCDFDLVLVDDGSPDRCGEICDEYVRQDSRVKVIHQANGGLSAARNAGIDWVMKNSSAEYITFVDSDDWIAENYLSELVHGTSFADEAVCTSYAIVDNTNNRNIRYPDRGWMAFTPEEYYLLYDCLNVVSWGKLFKRSLFEDVRFPVGKIHEDVFTTHQLLFQCKRIAFRQIATYNYFVRRESIMKSEWSPRRLDALSAYRAQCEYFRGRFPRAYQKAHAALLVIIVLECEHIKQYLPAAADEYQDAVDEALQDRSLPFWTYRGFYRAVGIKCFWLRWAIAMVADTLSNGRKSWLFVEALPIVREML